MRMAFKTIKEHSPSAIELQNLVNEKLMATPDAVLSDGWDLGYEGEQLVFFGSMVLKAATGGEVSLSAYRVKIFGGQSTDTLETEFNVWRGDQDPRSYYQHGVRFRTFGNYNAIAVLYSRGGP